MLLIYGFFVVYLLLIVCIFFVQDKKFLADMDEVLEDCEGATLTVPDVVRLMEQKAKVAKGSFSSKKGFIKFYVKQWVKNGGHFDHAPPQGNGEGDHEKEREEGEKEEGEKGEKGTEGGEEGEEETVERDTVEEAVEGMTQAQAETATSPVPDKAQEEGPVKGPKPKKKK